MESKEKKAKFHKIDPKLQYLEQMSFSNICTFLCLDQNRTLTDRWSNAAVIPKDKKNSFGFSIFGELRVNIRCASLYILNCYLYLIYLVVIYDVLCATWALPSTLRQILSKTLCKNLTM